MYAICSYFSPTLNHLDPLFASGVLLGKIMVKHPTLAYCAVDCHVLRTFYERSDYDDFVGRKKTVRRITKKDCSLLKK